MKKIRFLSVLMLAVMLVMSTAMAAGYVEVGATVNVRIGPGLNYEDLGNAYEGYTLTYLDESATDSRGVVWYCVAFEDEAGWVSSKYCTLYGEIYVYAVEGKSFIRKNPDLEAKQLAILYEGERAEYLGKTSVDDRGVSWYKVEYDGKIGWISSKYTVLGQEGVIYDRYILAEEGKTHIRDYPSLNGESVEILPEGETATYLEKKEWDERGVAWYKVRYDGTVGWVSSKYTTIYEDGSNYSADSKDLIDFSDFFVSSKPTAKPTSKPSSGSECSYCEGTGDCKECGGDMWVWKYKWVYVNGSPETKHVNELCDGIYCYGGSCSKCGGDGVI